MMAGVDLGAEDGPKLPLTIATQCCGRSPPCRHSLRKQRPRIHGGLERRRIYRSPFTYQSPFAVSARVFVQIRTKSMRDWRIATDPKKLIVPISRANSLLHVRLLLSVSKVLYISKTAAFLS